MTREEFALIWHDWLRGVSLIGVVLLLVAVHFAHIFSPENYALLVVGVALTGGLTLAGSVCLSGLAPLPVRIAAPLVALVTASLAFVGTWQAVHLGDPYASATLSSVEPSTTLAVPTDGLGESYLAIKGRPGASPSGKDKEVDLWLGLKGAGVAREWSLEFFKNKTAKGQRGSTSLGMRDADSLLLKGLVPGELTVKIAELKPETALPFEVSLHWPLVPPGLIRVVLLGAVVLAFFMAFLSARKNQFPFLLPFTLVLAAAYWFIGQGIPFRQPLLPLLGIVIGSGIAGSGLGYAVAKVMQKTLAPRE